MPGVVDRVIARTGAAARRLIVPARNDLRRQVEQKLGDLAGAAAPVVTGPVLIDAMWDNPNYWLRLALARAALGTAALKEVGLVGRWRRAECAGTLRRFGIEVTGPEAFDLADDFAVAARALVTPLREVSEILGWQLPEEFPAAIFYDAILKRQRAAMVDIRDPNLVRHVAEGLEAIALAVRVIGDVAPGLVLLSHAVNFHYAALAWVAARHGIPVIVLFGNYGTPRFWRISKPADVFECVDRPYEPDIAALTPAGADMLASRGRQYLERRRGGQTRDLGAQQAFALRRGLVDRDTMASRFGRSRDVQIVAVYASNWFDFPHACGMTQFRDFLDWLDATVSVAKQNTDVNWLFKPHPCDEWYGGITLKDLLPGDIAPHIRLAEPDWNGAAVTDAVDAIVTYHGTVGIEAAAIGKPVLAADRGWYDDCGFVFRPLNRQAYLAALGGEWWRGIDLAHARRRAEIFAGWYFEPPNWQDGFVTGDDSEQFGLYQGHIQVLARNGPEIAREVALLREWYASGQPFYHTYKVGAWVRGGCS